ncbi:hypothetical protein [Bradyrhizobium vignae]|uniref:Uncharacterized protein n=1 Tax=Bradyrhizobium vignae TaxID=1549949 RepID=A0ABS4A7J6_9BRAD|nr:hypothetical protein [Bradyrhizobium vignae]MBP0116390.1 hypothetical protein [Bradyrhizobium vignae]
MIIFPFGFYILDGKRPIYLGNNFEAQETMRNWMRLNPDKVLLRSDMVGATEIFTEFLGCDRTAVSATMCQGFPLLFKTTRSAHGVAAEIRRYDAYDDSIRGHTEIVQMYQRLH